MKPLSWTITGLASASLACSSGGEAGPAPGAYTVNFPSVQAAVAVDTLQVMAFDAETDDVCQSLVERRRSGQELPACLAETKALPTCSFLGEEPNAETQLTVGFGRRALLAIAKRGTDDFLLGCTLQDVAKETTATPIDVAILPGTRVPATTCTSLSQRCSGACPAP